MRDANHREAAARALGHESAQLLLMHKRLVRHLLPPRQQQRLASALVHAGCDCGNERVGARDKPRRAHEHHRRERTWLVAAHRLQLVVDGLRVDEAEDGAFRAVDALGGGRERIASETEVGEGR